MKISKISLKNFKRFTDLTIDNISDKAKLVLLIGSNGSGKSCIFDAFVYAISFDTELSEYYRKKGGEDFEITIQFHQNEIVTFGDKKFKVPVPTNYFYGRTSFRQIPRLTRTSLGQNSFNIAEDSDRPKSFIDKDNRFENDIEKITEIILKEFFSGLHSNEQIREGYINPINSALENIFRKANGTRLQLIEIIPPLEGKIAQINFRKGNSEIHYNYLSAGEKEVFNLLINLLSRRSLYQDTIYFFDEMDLHLNTKLQYYLIKEITENWIPENCQLWTATHSLGFIEYAKQNDNATIIDFDDLDFDFPKILSPEPKDNPDVYEIAVGKEFLPSLFQQMNICFVENQDKHYYASIGIQNVVFVSDNNRNSVYHKIRTSNFHGIVDRDFLSDDDIIEIRKQYPKLNILNYYSIENYLYHPHNLAEYFQKIEKPFNEEKYIAQLTEAKNQAKEIIMPTLALKRTEYPYFGEPEFNGTSLQNRFKNKQENEVQSRAIASNLSSNDFQTYYKLLPMKSYCTQLSQRQNISKIELTKTMWFKAQIEGLLNL